MWREYFYSTMLHPPHIILFYYILILLYMHTMRYIHTHRMSTMGSRPRSPNHIIHKADAAQLHLISACPPQTIQHCITLHQLFNMHKHEDRAHTCTGYTHTSRTIRMYRTTSWRLKGFCRWSAQAICEWEWFQTLSWPDPMHAQLINEVVDWTFW